MSTPRPFPSANDPSASRDTGLDDTIESSFPASDPPSTIPDPTSSPDSRLGSRYDAGAPYAEGRVAWSIEQQTARIPSDAFLWAAVGSMGVSAVLHAAGNKHASLFVGQWAPAFLLLGIYNKLVKQLGSDRYDAA